MSWDLNIVSALHFCSSAGKTSFHGEVFVVGALGSNVTYGWGSWASAKAGLIEDVPLWRGRGCLNFSFFWCLTQTSLIRVPINTLAFSARWTFAVSFSLGTDFYESLSPDINCKKNVQSSAWANERENRECWLCTEQGAWLNFCSRLDLVGNVYIMRTCKETSYCLVTEKGLCFSFQTTSKNA